MCRLLTLAGLRRRGVAPESINAFCREIGITRNANVIPYHKLEHHVRTHLDANSSRVLMVMRPLRVSAVLSARVPGEGGGNGVHSGCFPHKLEHHLNANSSRVLLVMRPLRVSACFSAGGGRVVPQPGASLMQTAHE